MTLAVRPAPLCPARFTAGPAPIARTLLDVLATTTAHHPTAAAIDAGGRVLSYRALTDEVEAQRAALAAAGIGVGDRVGVRVPSGTADLYVSILAVLAAGAAYVPVDADDPDERAELVFGEAGVCAVLGDGRRSTLRGTTARPPGAPGPDDDAWIIFTSGSTGKPKGVAVTPPRRRPRSSTPRRGCSCSDEPIGPGRPRARRPVGRVRRLLRGDVAGVAPRRLPGAGAALAGAHRRRPRPVAGRAGDHRRLDGARRWPRCGRSRRSTTCGC